MIGSGQMARGQRFIEKGNKAKFSHQQLPTSDILCFMNLTKRLNEANETTPYENKI